MGCRFADPHPPAHRPAAPQVCVWKGPVSWIFVDLEIHIPVQCISQSFSISLSVIAMISGMCSVALGSFDAGLIP